MESSFDITASKHVDGVTSRSFMSINLVLVLCYTCLSAHLNYSKTNNKLLRVVGDNLLDNLEKKLGQSLHHRSIV